MSVSHSTSFVPLHNLITRRIQPDDEPPETSLDATARSHMHTARLGMLSAFLEGKLDDAHPFMRDYNGLLRAGGTDVFVGVLMRRQQQQQQEKQPSPTELAAAAAAPSAAAGSPAASPPLGKSPVAG